MPCIEHAARLDQEQLDLPFCVGFVLDALWNDEHFTVRNMDCAISEIDPQITLHHDECFIGILMVVPDKVTLQLHDLNG